MINGEYANLGYIIDAEGVRLFFAGKELKNGNPLWMYNVDNDVVLVIMVM